MLNPDPKHTMNSLWGSAAESWIIYLKRVRRTKFPSCVSMINKMTSVKSRLRLSERAPEIMIIIIFTHLKNDTEKSVLILICAQVL